MEQAASKLPQTATDEFIAAQKTRRRRRAEA